jgi:hypothetical protein
VNDLWCFIICFGTTQVVLPASVDTFCTTYQQVVITKEDLDRAKALPRAMRDRLQGNELEYLCRCKGYKHNMCEEKKNG